MTIKKYNMFLLIKIKTSTYTDFFKEHTIMGSNGYVLQILKKQYDVLLGSCMRSSSCSDISRILKSMNSAFLLDQPKTLNFKEENYNGIY